jgi:hypothetical protein
MPSKSKAQHNLMEAVAHSEKFAKKVGIPQKVGKEFASADKKMKKDGGGLYANIHAKQERIKHGSKEHMRKVGSKGAPTKDAFIESAKTAKKASGGGVSLSVGRGEKLPTKQGAGLTAKGREKYNRETGSNLKAPQPQGGSRKKSFCARMEGVVAHSKGDAPRAKASLKRWNCKDGGKIKGW